MSDWASDRMDHTVELTDGTELHPSDIRSNEGHLWVKTEDGDDSIHWYIPWHKVEKAKTVFREGNREKVVQHE